jgi:hypothetical protein
VGVCGYYELFTIPQIQAIGRRKEEGIEKGGGGIEEIATTMIIH